jgi:Tfp pilus assembly PilM family ATPase
MATRIASELHIPVEVAEPFELVHGKDLPVAADAAPRWFTALGLTVGVN